jgi:hypothetical protein
MCFNKTRKLKGLVNIVEEGQGLGRGKGDGVGLA